MAGRRRIHKAWWILGIVLLLLGAFAVYLHWPVDNRIIISRETTHIDGPLNPDGTVNYVAALDAMLAEGVTSENNAAIPLLQAMGPRMLDPATRYETLRRLGMDDLPADGNYFQSWEEWAKANPKWFAGTSQPATGKRANDPPYYRRDSSAMNAPWKEADDPVVAAWLRDNELPMHLLTYASRRSRYYVPVVSKGRILIDFAWKYPPPLLLRFMHESFAVRAMKRLGEGDHSDAWEDILTRARLGRLISQSPAFSSTLQGYRIEVDAWEAGLVLLSTAHVPAQDARKMIADLESLPPLQPISSMYDRDERFMALDWVMAFSRGSRPQTPSAPSSAFDWNKMLRDMNAHYDKVVAAANLPMASGRLARAKMLEAEERTWFKENSGNMPYAKLILYRLGGRLTRGRFTDMLTCSLCSLLLSSVELSAAETEINQVWFDLFMAACALHAHRVEKGRYPASMEELSPSYLKQVPLDRFTDKALLYKPKADGYALQSVGPNGKDDGGKGDDIAVEMPRRTVSGE